MSDFAAPSLFDPTPAPRLSKRRFASGTRCPKLLWLETHEPSAPELAGQMIPTVLLEQGRQVGELARERFPGGRLVGDGRVAAFDLERAAAETRVCIEAGEPVLFEAVFLTDDSVAIVDILERIEGGWRLVEVKQSSDLHDEYVVDVAFQMYVLERCGVPVVQAAVMHLCRDCVYPDLEGLFTTVDVTEAARAQAAELPASVSALVTMLGGPMPDVAIDVPCVSPDPCTFKPRCWVGIPDHHVSTLYMIRKKEAFAHHHEGRTRIVDLELPSPASKKKPSKTLEIQWRQQEALQSGQRIVERERLAQALASLEYPVAMLDFETVQLAVPVWAGCTPQQQVPVQFSCHVIPAPGAAPAHHEWIARSSEDPRPRIAEALVAACQDARTVMAYFAGFEQGCLTRLAEWVPARSAELMAIHDKIVDLLPIVREHVYDPAFGGSFSIKRVLPALVPSLSYDGLTIAKGDVAAAELWRVMFGGISETEREYTCDALLEYCRRDTEAMVALHDQLRTMCG